MNLALYQIGRRDALKCIVVLYVPSDTGMDVGLMLEIK